MASKQKVTKSPAPSNLTVGSVTITKEDIKTITAAVRFGAVQFDTENISWRLGITKNAWNLRWRRAKLKLEKIQLDTVDDPKASPDPAAEADIDAIVQDMANERDVDMDAPEIKSEGHDYFTG